MADNDNVRPFRLVENEAPIPDEKIVEFAEALLAQAKSGRLHAVITIAFDHDGSANSYVTTSTFQNPRHMVHQLHLLQILFERHINFPMMPIILPPS